MDKAAFWKQPAAQPAAGSTSGRRWRRAYLSPREPDPPATGMAQLLPVRLLALKQIFL